MNFKKKVSGSWVDAPHYLRGTDTDTITSLPTTIYGDGTNATLTIKGNTTQSGTPSPSNPVDVDGCGERTANLTTLTEVTHNGYVKILTPADSHLFDNIEYDTEYTLSWEITSTSTSSVYNQIRFLRSNSTSVKEISNGGSFTLTSTEMSEIVSIAFYFGRNNTDGRMYNIMLNTGSTPQPYEPYGYKIPILNGSVTTNIYLGEEQTTRNVKKLVLTGQETVDITGNGSFYIESITDYLLAQDNICVSTHYQSIANTAGAPSGDNVINFNYMQTYRRLYIRDANISTVEDFKTYLQQQYANGTPVVVYYILKNSLTSTVNEPLMKIGSYADSLTTSIPTTDGANTLSIGTTVQPSEVTANYHGWHPVSDAHEMHTHLDSSLFELGTITGYGIKDDLTTRIRTKTFIDLSSTKKISASSSAKAFLIAWTEEATTISANYCVGGWNGSTFGMQTGLWLSEIDVESIVETYPTYKFAVILRYDDNREVTDFNDLLSLVDFYPITW